MRVKSMLVNNKWYFLGALFITLYYVITRLTNLVDIPIFTDEAIYIRWAQIGSQDASWRYISLTDGKQPLFVWGAMMTVRLFNDPLFAGRFISVISGFFSLVGIGLLARELFKSIRIGFAASLLYVTSPFALMYDRLAIMDSMVALFSIWSLYFAVLLVRTIRFDTALLLGFSMGAAVLTKTSGFINIYLLPFLLLLFDFSKKDWKGRLVKLIGLFIIAFVLSQIFYSVLRLSPWFHMIAVKDKTFIYPLSEWIEHPFRFFVGNIKALVEWMVGYLTIPIALLALFSVVLIKPKWREKLLLLVWALAPLFGLALFGKVLYPRFILFMAMPLFILAAWGINFIITKYKLSNTKKIMLITLAVIYPIFVQGKIIFSSLTAPIPKADRDQYITDMFSGWGIREVNAEIEKLAENGKVTIFTDGTFGLLPYGIEIYLVENPNVKIIGVWPTPDEYLDEMLEEIKKNPTYFVANNIQSVPEKWNAVVVGKWQKGLRKERHLRLFRLYEPGYTPTENESIRQ